MRLLAAAAALVCWASAATAQSALPIGSGTTGSSVLSVQAAPDGAAFVSGRFPGLPYYSLVRLDAAGVRTLVPPGPAGMIGRMAVAPDGVLYAAGFDGPSVGRWDGTRWTQLPNVVPYSCTACIKALALGRDGSLYLAGRFTTGPGINEAGVWRFDGTAWAQLGGPMAGTTIGLVEAVAVAADGSVYAGGLFASAGGVAARNIARWDGTAWAALGSGTDQPVVSLAIGQDGSVYAGGRFTTAGGVPAPSIARWDGAAWHGLGSGIDASPYTPVAALAIAPDGSLVVAGTFSEAGGVAAGNVARWDGAAWHPIGAGLPDRVNRIAALSTGALVADVSSRGYYRWDGTAWSPPGPDTNARVRAVSGAGNTSFVGGDFTTVGGIQTTGVARWTTELGWRPLGSGIGGTVAALAAASPSSVYAGGAFGTAGATAAANVAWWNGSAWSALGAGTDAPVRALALTADGVLVAGGDFTEAGGTPARHVAQWSGADWQPLGAGLDGPVYALTVGPDGMLYAAGDFATAGGTPARHIARWDGAAWSPLGVGTDAAVRALTVGLDGALYAGGDFTAAGGTVARHIARWTGSVWTEVGGGTDAPVRALEVIPAGQFRAGQLLAGGDFATAGSVAAGRLARWDGSAWLPIGAGVTGASVDALSWGPDPLVVFGGDFSGTADAASPFVAALHMGALVAEAPEPAAAGLALSVGPNPTRGAATAFVTAEAPATVEVFDALGRRVGRGEAPAGERVAIALPTERLAPGVYVVRLVAGDRVRTARLVITR